MWMQPLPSNILTWHYCVRGPEKTPYEGGYYHGKLVFPREFPFKPPAIYMITPNGRFKVNQKLCLSISDFHPDTWNPAWSVSTILTGLLSFMLENTPTSGAIDSSEATKRRFASDSLEFNIQDTTFKELFPDLVDECKRKLQKLKDEAEARLRAVSESTQSPANGAALNPAQMATQMATAATTALQQNRSWLFSLLNNMIVMICLVAFAFVVKYVVFNTM